MQSDMLRRQTLTATHDKSTAWSGLGSAIMSFSRHSSARHPTRPIAAYLICIAVFHISAAGLFRIVLLDHPSTSPFHTTLGVPNMTAAMCVPCRRMLVQGL